MKRSKPPWHLNRRYLNDIDRDIAEEEADERVRAEADYESWRTELPRAVEGYDEPDPAYNPADPDDRLERERGRL